MIWIQFVVCTALLVIAAGTLSRYGDVLAGAGAVQSLPGLGERGDDRECLQSACMAGLGWRWAIVGHLGPHPDRRIGRTIACHVIPSSCGRSSGYGSNKPHCPLL